MANKSIKQDKSVNVNSNENYELTDLTIKGARENNLKNVSLEIPREKFVVITGLSGSGKSSLAFDTIYAEGQRRYIECLSSYAKQFIGMMKKPDVDSIEGLSPSISIEQKTLNLNPRSTVGTTTEIYDYIRLLFAKIGIQHCVDCDVPVIKRTHYQIVQDIFKNYYKKDILILAPLVRARKGQYNELFVNMINQGFTKVRIDGEIHKLGIELDISRYKTHDIELVIDKCSVDEEHSKRLETSIELALNKSDGSLMIIEEDENISINSDSNNLSIDNNSNRNNNSDKNNNSNVNHQADTDKHSSKKISAEPKLYSTNYSCPKCHKSYRSLAPNVFSFNSPYGACPECNGLGEIEDFDENLLIPNKSISVIDGAIKVLGEKKKSWLWSQLEKFAEIHNIPLDIPIRQLNKEKYKILLYGIDIDDSDNKKTGFNGFITNLRSLYSDAYSYSLQRELTEYRKTEVCLECNGSRLKKESLAVKIHGYNINDVVTKDIQSCIEFFDHLDTKFNDTEKKIAPLITKEIKDRLRFLINVGLPYFSLNRTVNSLSGGEAQRIRLASQIGSQLVGITYVLDEPSIGLHQHDNNKLINSLKQLRDLGNSIIVVEHDRAMIKEADYVVDIGPGAGVHGGEIILASETNNLDNLPKEIKNKSLTYQYINNIKKIEPPKAYRKPSSKKKIVLKGATGNNLRNVNLEIPLGVFICVTGMSGSGKSSLINDTLFPILSNKLHHSLLNPLPYKNITGIELVNKVIEIDQKPIGRTPRSNPATYTKTFDTIRTHYASLTESTIRGYKSGRFSFNVSGGRCEECEGAGIKKLEMNFLPDVYVTCDSCNGKRYNEETLQIKFKGKTIADVLDLTVEEALIFFENIPKLKSKLKILNEVGLGYIKLGQQAPTLSGGEAQRVKLATELARPSTGKTIFLLDEPTTGLHFEDIRLLLILLQHLVDKGNTVIVIEHNFDVIKCADWVIDLGPEGGSKGGEIVAQGNPFEITQNSNSITGKYLKKEFEES